MKRTLISCRQQTQWRVTSPSSKHHARVRNLPRNILLLRHGQSLGNVDEHLFATTPDWKIPLSERGKAQARDAGLRIKKIVGDAPLAIYVSPYRRTKETLQEVLPVLPNHPILFTREEPRLREQDFGNFQDPERIQQAKKERPQFGRFFYRFPDGGESGADVFDRVSAFSGTFLRDMTQISENRGPPPLEGDDDPEAMEYYKMHDVDNATALFVTHGITARLFLMRWLHWTVEEFEELHNPPNCGLLHLQKKPDGTGYRLTDACRELIRGPEQSGGAMKLGDILADQRRREMTRTDRAAFDALAENAWGM